MQSCPDFSIWNEETIDKYYKTLRAALELFENKKSSKRAEELLYMRSMRFIQEIWARISDVDSDRQFFWRTLTDVDREIAEYSKSSLFLLVCREDILRRIYIEERLSSFISLKAGHLVKVAFLLEYLLKFEISSSRNEKLNFSREGGHSFEKDQRIASILSEVGKMKHTTLLYDRMASEIADVSEALREALALSDEERLEEFTNRMEIKE